MGNAVSTSGGPVAGAARASSSGADPFLSELGGEIQYDKSMGTSRFLKTIRGRYKQGAVVVKVFIKQDPSLSLKSFHRAVKAEREALQGCPNVLPYARSLETEKAGYLIRQWSASNLYDRISTRPFLSVVEKRWIAFQLLTGLAHARKRNVSHGDIKTENIAVTSWNWVFLTDFASFKPTFLPLDDPSTFSYFFDTSSRRSCYVAPERFYSADSGTVKRNQTLEAGKTADQVTEAMDVFALGCVFAELWMEGTPPFTLSQLFKYREGLYSPESYLAEIDDVEIRNLIRSMLSLDPASRLSCADYLDRYRGLAFPDIFYTFLHPFISSLNDCVPSGPTAATPALGVSTPTGTHAAGDPAGMYGTLKSDADERIERVWSEWEMIREYLDRDAGMAPGGSVFEDRTQGPNTTQNDKDTYDPFPIKLHLPGAEGQIVHGGSTEDGPALVLLSLICANLRNCVRPASIVRALDIMLALLPYLSDETKLDRLIPYVVTVLQDDMAFIRAAAVKTLTQTLLLVKIINPSNAAIFSEYVLPNTRALATDPEVLPRATYAQCIAALAQQAKMFLEMTEAMKTEGTFKVANLHDFAGSPYDENYDSRLQELQLQIQEHVAPLLSDPAPVVKRALLYHVGALCTFFGPLKANDAILAHLVTYLNTRDWQLRAAWNENAVDVASCVGSRSLEEYILPLISLSLADIEETVIVKTLATITTLTDRRLLTKGRTWEIVSQVTGFLCHPNIWIREGTAAFLTNTARRLNPTDCWCILYPSIKRLLRADVKEITELSLLDNAREPLSRVIFEAAVTWAGRAGKSPFWSPRGSVKGAPRDASVRTDEDHAQLDKMRALGMKPEDEFKLSMMRDYISKLAAARQAMPTRAFSSDATDNGSLVLSDLGIVPQTIFFSVKSANELSKLAKDIPSRRVSNASRKFSLDPSPGSPLSIGQSRAPSSRNVSGQPGEDLRRRLALTGGGSTSSLSTTNEAASNEPADSAIVTAEPPTDLYRTTSVASTVTSDATTSTRGADIVQPVPRSRVHHNTVNVGRAGAAVAEDALNAEGLFELDTRYKTGAGQDAMSEVTSAIRGPESTSKRSIAGQRFVTTYDGNDPSIKHLLERVYLDTYREPLPELGSYVPVGIPRRRALRTNFPPRERTPNRPSGTPIAHLIEHTGAITDIQVSPDQLFFATGSEDGTVKIWDTIRLEKNVTSRSRQTFQQGGKITSVCVIENSHCVASASDNGTLLLHRVDVSLSGSMPRYGKVQLIRQQRSEQKGDYVTCLLSYNTAKATNLVYGTSLSSVVVLDIRTMRNQQVFQNPLHFGPVTSLCIDRQRVWLVVGTASGTLSLWDLRFGLMLRSWSAGLGQVQSIAVHPSQGKGRWIIVSIEDSGQDDVANQHGAFILDVWDIDAGRRFEEYRVAPQRDNSDDASTRSKGVLKESPAIMNEASLDPAAAIEALLASNSQYIGPESRTRLALPGTGTSSTAIASGTPLKRPGVKAFLVGSDYAMQTDARPSTSNAAVLGAMAEIADSHDGKKDGGYLITGGEDRQLRFWDLGKISKSLIFSGRDLEDEAPTYSAHTSSGRPALFLESPAPSRARAAGSSGHRVHRSTLIANSQQQLLRGHQEAVTALAVIDVPFRCVVSGDRSGVVKVSE